MSRFWITSTDGP